MRYLFRPPAAEAAGLLTLPWDQPLEEWDPDLLLEVPQRGISRHVVRFVADERPGLRAQGDRTSGWPATSTRCSASSRSEGCRRSSVLGICVDRPGRPGRDPGDPLPRVLDVLPVRCSPARAARTRPTGCSTRWWSCWSGCTWPASSGATARCPTRCSGSTPARWPPTWSTPRRPSGTRRCRAGQRAYDVDLARERVGARAVRPAGRRAAARRTSTRSRSPTSLRRALRGAVGRADPRGGVRAERAALPDGRAARSGSTTSASTSARWS